MARTPRSGAPAPGGHSAGHSCIVGDIGEEARSPGTADGRRIRCGALPVQRLGQHLQSVDAVIDKAQERSREIAQGLSEDITGPIKSALKEGQLAWRSFSEAVAGIARNLASRLIDAAFRPIEDALVRAFSGAGGGGGFIASLFGFARGGAFAGGREITAFARGGVVDRPVVFPFARGVGLMGEAGPEAILPLRRGRDGRLGVELSGEAPAPAPEMSTRIINVLDPSVVGDYLATPAGERAIVNVIRRNRSALNG